MYRGGVAILDIDQVMQLWWVFPVSIIVATIALSSGISGALFFSPLFLLVIGLSPAQAIGAGLMTEAFGTSFGSFNYIKQRLVDFKTARFLLIAAIPMGIFGAWLAYRITSDALQIVLGIMLIVLAVVTIRDTFIQKKPIDLPDKERERGMTTIKGRDGTVYSYQVCNRSIGISLAGIGSLLNGLVSAGLAAITTTQLIVRCRIPPRVAVATAIFVLTVTDFFAAGVHALNATPAWHVVIWSIPGVIVGAQIGPRLSGKLPTYIAQRFIAIVFLALGLLVIVLGYFD